MTTGMVGEMVQNSQSLYSFTFNVVIIIHEYIYSHSTTKFIFKKYIFTFNDVFRIHEYIYSHLRDVFIDIHDRNIGSTRCNIHSTFSAHRLRALLGPSSRSIVPERRKAYYMKG